MDLAKFRKGGIIAVFVGLLLLTAYICFYNLQLSFFENWDEAWYGEITKQMIKTGDYIVPRWNQTYLLDKPPLNFWLDVMFVAFFGLSELAVRLPSAISGFAIIVLTTVFAYRRFGFVASLFSFSAVAFNTLLIWRTRTGNLDALTTLLILISFFLMISNYKNRYPWLGLTFGLLFLEKASMVFFPLGVFVLHELLFMRHNWKENLKSYIAFFILLILPGGIWLTLGTLKLGKVFYEYFLFHSDQDVAAVTLKDFKLDYILATYYSLQRYLFFVFGIGLLFMLRQLKQRYFFALLLFSISLIALLTFTKKNNNWYLVPATPFWGLTIAYAIQQLLEFGDRFIKKQYLGFIFLLPLIYISYKTFTGHIIPMVYAQNSIPEVKSARTIRDLSQPGDSLMRLDFSHPVMVYYSDRKTFFYPQIDDTIYRIIKDQKITWVVGKNDQVQKFLQNTHGMEFDEIPVGDETVLRRTK